MAAEEKFNEVTTTKGVFLIGLAILGASLVLRGIDYAWNNIGSNK